MFHEGAVYPRIRVKLEKPTAVTFADAPMIEMLVDADPYKGDKLAKEMWDEAIFKDGRDKMLEKKPPFPLQGRLDEWIAKNEPAGIVR